MSEGCDERLGTGAEGSGTMDRGGRLREVRQMVGWVLVVAILGWVLHVVRSPQFWEHRAEQVLVELGRWRSGTERPAGTAEPVLLQASGPVEGAGVKTRP